MKRRCHEREDGATIAPVSLLACMDAQMRITSGTCRRLLKRRSEVASNVLQAAKTAFAEKRRGELAEDVITHLANAVAELYES